MNRNDHAGALPDAAAGLLRAVDRRMKFCVNCRHYRELNMQCARPHEPVMNPVTGTPYGRSPVDAQYERESEHRPSPNDRCGMDGKYFEDKHGTMRYVCTPTFGGLQSGPYK